ncbi:MAG TPA: cupin domain-containing protein [Casimicrobiaceae bacterium]|nr:cupin domain-containing protein [Casimicrobiaceae bacterium]
MEFIERGTVDVFVKSGIESHQLLFPENSPSSRVTITKVVVAPGATNPRHRHETSEQVWVALAGAGHLLLADERTMPFREGDVVRFADGDVHGLENSGSGPFVYLSVTSPPINFRKAYGEVWQGA